MSKVISQEELDDLYLDSDLAEYEQCLEYFGGVIDRKPGEYQSDHLKAMWQFEKDVRKGYFDRCE